MDNNFQLDGIIIAIDETRPAKEGSSLMLRNFILDKPTNGDSNQLNCQLKNSNCEKLNEFLPGDKVIIYWGLSGAYGGAKPKEGHPICPTNPKGLTCFSPTVNVFDIEFAPGFKRHEKIVNNATVNQNNNNTVNQNNGTSNLDDDLPF